ncbi:hypothetical protein BKH43_01225 [Helicobacter sp. 13S00401-1]|uniref:acylphosphatase n=1 Tax=Helicobacter sp. 13S00401-1 TaxID=1905758 RepID=UPI000BA5B096|nr:acylphosphatase [Helicobacter sp. 13S00401-1]PAF51882.1 hypothetical protein BKH43_01225 [Helicobacter sp. 13S00401-1]
MTYHILATGKVQGVGFRNMTERLAKLLNLKGTVQNLENGQVEIYINADEKDLESLKASLFEGNSKSRLDKLDCKVIDDIDFEDFVVLR